VLVSEIEYERYLSGASLEQEYAQTGIIELLGESQQKGGRRSIARDVTCRFVRKPELARKNHPYLIVVVFALCVIYLATERPLIGLHGYGKGAYVSRHV